MVLPTKNKGKEKKIGHRRVNKNTGEVTYKKTTSASISGAIQLGIAHSVGQLSREPERDILTRFINDSEDSKMMQGGVYTGTTKGLSIRYSNP